VFIMKNLLLIYCIAMVLVSLFVSPILGELPNRSNSANLASKG